LDFLFNHDLTLPEGGSLLTLLLFGLAVGARHALEADHMAAVATLVTDRRSVWSSSVIGGLWGLGHTLSLLIAGVAVIVLHVQIPERLAQGLEFGVGLMLVGLAVGALVRLRRGEQLHVHTHEHGGVIHQHPHWHTHSHEEAPHSHDPAGAPVLEPAPVHHRLPASLRPVLVGMVHGMAGSAALMLMLLTTIGTVEGRFLYLASFGLGSIGGMMLTSGLIGLPLALTARRFERWNRGLQASAAVMSLGIGLMMVYNIGWVEGLLPH
jgi:ABC-type nickel/cobalt efflux system permease component RcnA